jgi:glycosyltransferase involved in cell wall biosynthesis
MSSDVEISIIIPLKDRCDDVGELYRAYKNSLEMIGQGYEFIYVLDGQFPDVRQELKSLQKEGERIKVIQLAKRFGEATALTAGFENSSGNIILTLTPHYQVEPSEIPKFINALKDHDMVIGRRWPRTGSLFNRFQAGIFNRVFSLVIGSAFQDLGCGVRAFKRKVADEVPVYGDQHRFFPVLASYRGFKVKEVDVKQSAKDDFRRVYHPGVYLRQILGILAVFFLVKFTKKPLRFFGMIGVITSIIGGIFLLYLIIERLFWGGPLAERPAMLLSSLLLVLGIQILALGLIGELIIFTHARELKEYTIEEIIN